MGSRYAFANIDVNIVETDKCIEIGVQARFEETSIEDVEKILGTQGLPPHLALATAELFGALGFEEPVIFADEVVQASDVSTFCPLSFDNLFLMTGRLFRRN
jgi:hypothetical protein